jgi:simple sugar transport system permease protein
MNFASLTFEKAAPASTLKTAVVLGLALVCAALSATVLLALYGVPPLRMIDVVLFRTLGSSHGWSEVVRRGTPVLLIGLGILAGSRAQFWNLGADGQMLIGAVGAAGVALFSHLPGPLLLPAMFVAGVAGAAGWAMIPCLLRAKFGISEIITGLMMNYIASNLVDWLIQGPWRGSSAMGYAYTNSFPSAGWLPLIPGTRISWTMTLLGIVLAVILHVVLFQTRTGVRVRILGESPSAARYAGVNPYRILLFVGLVAGGTAGLAGVGEVAGFHHKLLSPHQITLGYGFTSVVVALLARGKPLYVLITALLLGIILASSDVITVVLHLPMEVINIFTGLILYFLICGDFFLKYRLRVRWPLAREALPA